MTQYSPAPVVSRPTSSIDGTSPAVRPETALEAARGGSGLDSAPSTTDADGLAWTWAASCVVVALSVAALVAWAFDHPLRLVPWSGAMLPNAALAGLAIGSGLAFVARGSVTAASWCAGAAIALAFSAVATRAIDVTDVAGNLVAQALGREMPSAWRLAMTTALGFGAAGVGLALASAARARRPLLLGVGLCGMGVVVLGLTEAIAGFRHGSAIDAWRFGGSMSLPAALTLVAAGVGLASLSLSRRLAPDARELGVPLLAGGVFMAATFGLAHAAAGRDLDLYRQGAQREAERLAGLMDLDLRLGILVDGPGAMDTWLEPRAPPDHVVSVLRNGRRVARATHALRGAAASVDDLEAPGLSARADVAGSSTYAITAAPVRAMVEQPGSWLPIIMLVLGLGVSLASASAIATGRSLRRRMESERAAHAARVETDARWRAVNDSSPVGIYFATTGGECLFVNPACRSIMGIEAAQAVGFGWTDFIHPDDRARVFAEFESSRLAGRDFACEYRMVRPDGGLVWVSVRAAVARDGHRALGIVGTVEEITERRRAEEQSRARMRELETLLTVSAHDLQEPLRAMSGLASALREDYSTALGDEGRDLLERLARGAWRMSELVEAVGALVRVQALVITPNPVDGARMVEVTLESLAADIRRTGARIEVVGPFPQLRGDPSSIGTALTHLVANAIKFTMPGEAPEIEIAAFATPELQEMGFVVRDRGPGVSPEQGELIFRLFRRAVGREVQGLGVGLAVARAVAERHGGRAFVRPRAGGGSEFCLTFGAGIWSPGPPPSR